MAQDKGKIKQVNPSNELIKSLPDKDYIQNPILYSQICGNFSLMQTNIMLSLVRSIRDRIVSHIEPGKGIVGPLFSDDEIKGNVTFKIPLRDMGVDSRQYGEVSAAAEALSKVTTSYEYYEDGRKRRSYESVFPRLTVPMDQDANGKDRRNGYIEVEMSGMVVSRIFNTSNQYVEHITDIAKLCNSPRTPRLYVYLSAWRKTQSEVTLKYDAVREFLGMLEYTQDHSKVKEHGDKCPKYALFHRDVLKPAQIELEKLAYKGQVDFFFTYEPIYHGGKTRGVNPDQIKFVLHPSEEASNIIDAAYQKMWTAFTQAIHDKDLGFYETCVAPCKLVDVTKNRENRKNKVSAHIQMPNAWVVDQWREKWCMLNVAWSGTFGEIMPVPSIEGN